MKINDLNADPGIYVEVLFSEQTKKNIADWLVSNNIPNAISPEKIHTTVVYSQKTLSDWKSLGIIDPLILTDPTEHKLEIWDTDDGFTLVCHYESDFLKDRFDLAVKLGYEPRFPDYKPHMTLSYDLAAAVFN